MKLSQLNKKIDEEELQNDIINLRRQRLGQNQKIN